MDVKHHRQSKPEAAKLICGPIEHKSINDCAVVAVVAVTGKPYEFVASELRYSPRHGVMCCHLDAFLSAEGFTRQPIPRRGQDKMTGLIRLTSGSKFSVGHLVIIVNGLIFDGFVKGMPIAEYRAKHRRSTVVAYWAKVAR